MNDYRRADLAKIHLGKKQLALDDDAYRDMLSSVAGVRSAADLDGNGRRKVLDHLRRCGAKFGPPRRAGRRPHNYERLPEQVAKVEALLADMGLSWAYADTLARQVTGGRGAPDKDPGVEKLAWVKRPDHWRSIIAALHVEHEKRSKQEAIRELLQKAGKEESYVDQWLSSNGISPHRWWRRRNVMRSIIMHLQEVVGHDHDCR